MTSMARKNMNLPDEVVRLIGDVYHKARFKSETETVIKMLEGASDRLKEAKGYVYLMRGKKGLKIGTSIQPKVRAKQLSSELLFCIPGDRLTELAVHQIWGRYRLVSNAEWFEDRKEIFDWFEGHEMNVPLDDLIYEKGSSELGRPLSRLPHRDRPIPVLVSQDEYAELEKAAGDMGVGVSTYLRLKALEAARS